MALPNNKVRGKQLKEKVEVVLPPTVTPPAPVTLPTPAPVTPPAEVTPPVEPPAPVVTDPATPPAIDVEMDLDELSEKKKEELTPEQLEYLKEHQDFLSPDQRVAFGFVADPNPPAPAPETTPKPGETDWQARYAGSTREAQVLVEAKKKLTNAVDDAENIAAPTDAEMEAIHGKENWEMLDDAQREIAKAKEHNQKKLDYIRGVRAEFKKADEFVEKAKAFTQDPEVLKNCPKLEGHEQEFLQYCAMPSHIGVDLEVLYRAFTTELPAPAAPQRKTLLEPGGGGAAPTSQKGPEYTPEQVAYMRIHKPKEYAKAVKEKKIKIEV